MMRQRLVGALVLLCFGIIVWSMLFTGSVDSRVDRDSQIPSQPLIDPVLEQSPTPPEGIPRVGDNRLPPQPTLPVQDQPAEDKVESGGGGEGVMAAAEPPDEAAKPAATASTSTPTTPAVKPEPAPSRQAGTETAAANVAKEAVLDARGLPQAWVIQVGSFGSKANADALEAKLRKRGYKAFVDQIQRGAQTLFRVQVGPVLEEARARALKQEIDRGFGVKSLVNRFEG